MPKRKNTSELKVTNVFTVGKLTITVRANEPSQQAIAEYNEKLNQLFLDEIDNKSSDVF